MYFLRHKLKMQVKCQNPGPSKCVTRNIYYYVKLALHTVHEACMLVVSMKRD